MVDIPVLEGMGAKDDGGRLVIPAGTRALTAVKGGETGKGCMTEDARQRELESVQSIQSTEYLEEQRRLRYDTLCSHVHFPQLGRRSLHFSALQLFDTETYLEYTRLIRFLLLSLHPLISTRSRTNYLFYSPPTATHSLLTTTISRGSLRRVIGALPARLIPATASRSPPISLHHTRASFILPIPYAARVPDMHIPHVDWLAGTPSNPSNASYHIRFRPISFKQPPPRALNHDNVPELKEYRTQENKLSG